MLAEANFPAPSSSASTLPKPNQYRPDIDGLRAIAIVSVVLFHFGFSCPGGFVGVDVFFVISGYLITKHLERELQQGRLSMMGFYHRRIRRIFPALFAVFALSALVAYVVLPPRDLLDFGKSLAAAAAFCSNILFNRSTGYFTNGSALRPLLHTWSLSVEEQFYIFWPLILAVVNIRALARWKMPLIFAIFVASFVLSAYWVDQMSQAAFYLIPSRMWELMVGAILSITQVSRQLVRMPRRLCHVLSVIGLLLLAASILTFTSATPFPGPSALLPCLGSALLIAAGERHVSLGGRLLALRPFVWIGLLSYSLYLWHWPVLVFSRVIANRELTTLERLLLILLTLALSWLSWKFIETPLRNPQVFRIQRNAWVAAGVLASLTFIALGAGLFLSKGFPNRAPRPEPSVVEARSEFDAFEVSPCLSFNAAIPDASICLLGARTTGTDHNVILWGDSHAAMLAPAINKLGTQLGFTARQITKAGCAPITGINVLPTSIAQQQCRAFNDEALRTVVDDTSSPLVILAASWDRYVDGRFLLTTGHTRPSHRDSVNLFIQSLSETITRLTQSGHHIVLVSQTPTPPDSPVECMTRAEFNHQNNSVCATMPSNARAAVEAQINQAITAAIMRSAADQHQPSLVASTPIVHPYNYLCGTETCSLITDGHLLYLDDNHLTAVGASLVEAGLSPAISQTLTQIHATRQLP